MRVESGKMKNKKYKDSGIPWIGMIPSDWSVEQLSGLFCEHKKKNSDLSETNLLSLSYGKIIRKDINTKEGLLPQSFDNYNIIDNGDIVFRLTDLQNDKRSLRTGLCTERGIITSAYITLRKRQKLDSSFFHYLFHSYDICKVFYGLGDGVRQGMNFADLRKLLVLLPPLPTQQRIADFLDKKCAEIDELSALQETMIAELKRYKQSVITEAVTGKWRVENGKLKDESGKMKDSGIPWIGEIPSHWEVNLLGSIFVEHKLKNDGMLERNLLSLSYGKIIRKNIDAVGGLLPMSYEGYNIIDKNDIVLRMTDLQNDHKSLRSGLCKERGIITSAYITIRSRQNNCCTYMHYLIHTYDICKVFYGMGDGVRQGINYSDIKNIRLIVPPLSEQQAIADYLDEKCGEIDELIAIKQQKIEQLKEYKKSVIFEYVTGKKEVES